MTVFVTGGLGFIGSNFVFAHLKRHAADSIVILDNHSYAANSKNIYGLYEDYRASAERVTYFAFWLLARDFLSRAWLTQLAYLQAIDLHAFGKETQWLHLR